MTAPVPRPVDVHALPAMLTALRLPSIQRHWPALAGRADAEGWPASRFLAALAEIELADRDARRIQRHLRESGLPGGKTLATFDFKALAGVPRDRIEALADGGTAGTGQRSSYKEDQRPTIRSLAAPAMRAVPRRAIKSRLLAMRRVETKREFQVWFQLSFFF